MADYAPWNDHDEHAQDQRDGHADDRQQQQVNQHQQERLRAPATKRSVSAPIPTRGGIPLNTERRAASRSPPAHNVQRGPFIGTQGHFGDAVEGQGFPDNGVWYTATGAYQRSRTPPPHAGGPTPMQLARQRSYERSMSRSSRSSMQWWEEQRHQQQQMRREGSAGTTSVPGSRDVSRLPSMQRQASQQPNTRFVATAKNNLIHMNPVKATEVLRSLSPAATKVRSSTPPRVGQPGDGRQDALQNEPLRRGRSSMSHHQQPDGPNTAPLALPSRVSQPKIAVKYTAGGAYRGTDIGAKKLPQPLTEDERKRKATLQEERKKSAQAAVESRKPPQRSTSAAAAKASKVLLHPDQPPTKTTVIDSTGKRFGDLTKKEQDVLMQDWRRAKISVEYRLKERKLYTERLHEYRLQQQEERRSMMRR